MSVGHHNHVKMADILPGLLDLPNEIVNEIILMIDPTDLFRASKVSKEFKKLVYNRKQVITTYYEFIQACEQGNILSLLRRGFKYKWYDCGFTAGCKAGHLEVIQYIIFKGCGKWNLGLYAGCIGGQLEIVKLMLSKGVTSTHDENLYDACAGGNIEIVKLMITRGNNNWLNGSLHAYRQALLHACKNGRINIVQFMIDNGANNLNQGLNLACQLKYKDIVQLLINRGANSCDCGKLTTEH